LRVGQLLENERGRAFQGAIQREESVLFDETDNQIEEEKVSYITKGSNQQNQYLPQISSDSSLQKDQDQIPLIDKTKRAFSLSIESSKAFELAIRKPRKKMKHKITSVRSGLYGIYLLLMKHHGSPTKAKDFGTIFILYSMFIAIDCMLLFNYTLHLFVPTRNY